MLTSEEAEAVIRRLEDENERLRARLAELVVDRAWETDN